MKLKGIQLEGIYKINFGDDWFELFDEKDKRFYFESTRNYWTKREFDEIGNETYYEHSNGYWEKSEYDSNNNRIYYIDSDGYWEKCEYDEKSNRIYFENVSECIIDDRPKELTLEQIEVLLGYKIKIKGE